MFTRVAKAKGGKKAQATLTNKKAGKGAGIRRPQTGRQSSSRIGKTMGGEHSSSRC